MSKIGMMGILRRRICMIKRYDIWPEGSDFARVDVEESEDGDWVLFSDYKSVLALFKTTYYLATLRLNPDVTKEMMDHEISELIKEATSDG